MADGPRRRTAANRVRRLLDGGPGVTPPQALAGAVAVTRLAVDPLVNDRELFMQGVDRVQQGASG